MNLVERIYFLCESLPRTEQYGLASQMKRAAVSVPSNIAEGKKRRTKKDFIHFLNLAEGSSAELETQVLLTKRLFPKVDTQQVEGLLLEVQKMLSVMSKNLSEPKSSI